MVRYLLTSQYLNQDNLSVLSVTISTDRLCGSNQEECIRGQSSFGIAFELNGLGTAYLSLAHPQPKSNEFYSDGYITHSYISKTNAIQAELHTEVKLCFSLLMFRWHDIICKNLRMIFFCNIKSKSIRCSKEFINSSYSFF